MSTPSDVTPVTEEAEPTWSLDLDALDAAMSPLRRVLRYAQGGGTAPVRYLEVIGGRWVARAMALDAPPACTELLQMLDDALQGYDAASAELQEDRRAVMYAALARIDALFGLPRPVRPARAQGGNRGRRRSKGSAKSQATAEVLPEAPPEGAEGTSARTGRGSRRKSRRQTARPPKALPVEVLLTVEPASEAPLRYGDDALAGGEIADLEGSAEVHAALAEAGLVRVGQLLALRPVSEEVVQPVLGSGRITEPGRHAIGGRVRRRVTTLHSDGTRESEVMLQGAGPTRAIWPGGAPEWLIERLAPGVRTVLVGEVSLPDDGPATLTQAELAVDDGKHAARLAQYGLAVPDVDLRALILQALEGVERLIDPVPSSLLLQRGLSALSDAMLRAHTHGARGLSAGKRLAYDEALLVQLALLWGRFQGTRERGVQHALLHGLVSKVLQQTDALLTDEQQIAFEEVKRDLRAPLPMRRVLTGEVGVGKGLVALLSSVLVAENKHQVMVLAPDNATAEQRFAFTEPALREVGLVARLLDADPSKAQRDAVRRGEVHILFGSTALLDANLEFRRLGLIVAGERDVFGRVPRQVADLRAPSPDLLLITSTPVPQPVLLAAYPAFDITVLKQPPGEPVQSEVVEANDRSGAYEAAAEAVKRGEQVVVVFPMSRGADVLDVREAVRIVATLEERVFEGARVRLFHGAMSREERYRVYTDFQEHRIDVLLATTHFEAGPAVPNVSTVIVEQADRMGLSRLHRVRGHVAVSRHAPRCVLITGEHPDATGVERVKRFAGTREGFEVSVQELETRGLADMVDGDASTEPRFQWLDPNRDIDTLVLARADARAILESDPGLRRGTYLELARYLRARWPDLLELPCPIQVSGAPGRRRRRRRKR